MAEEKKSTSSSKGTVKLTEAQKQKEKEKLALQKAKEKEKLALQKAKEKEKEKLALQKAKEKEKLALQKAKEKEKLALQKAKEKEKEKETKKVATTKMTSKPIKKSTEKIEIESLSKTTPIIQPKSKKSLEDLVKDKAKKVDNTTLIDDKPLDHVEILRKKMEAQKKLKENICEPELKKSNDEINIRTKLQAVIDQNESTYLENDEFTDEKSTELIKQLEDTIEMLTNEMKNKDNLINKQDIEIKDKGEQIVVLTNSIVGKTSESELIKQIEQLKHENDLLKEGLQVPTEKKVETPKEEIVDINDDAIKEIIAQGDILLRIKLLNERIAEKDAQIQLVEDELNRLSEKDIVALSFTQQIKSVRESRKELIERANIELKDLSGYIKNNEEKLKNKKQLKEDKNTELKSFDKELKEKKLGYLEKEEEMNKRSRIIAEFDALSIEIAALEEEYKKICNRYKKVLKVAEEQVDAYNKHENSLISLYLKQLRDEKTADDVNYKNQKEERESLLLELNKLNKVYEEMKAQNILVEFEEINPDELDKLKKEYAKLKGKLNLIAARYEERVKVEEVLRTVDPEVSKYLKAFEEKERLVFDNKIKEEELNSTDKNVDSERISIMISDNLDKIKFFDTVIAKNEANEKVVFYKQLLKSMAEIKEKEAIILSKANELKERIDSNDYDKDDTGAIA